MPGTMKFTGIILASAGIAYGIKIGSQTQSGFFETENDQLAPNLANPNGRTCTKFAVGNFCQLPVAEAMPRYAITHLLRGGHAADEEESSASKPSEATKRRAEQGSELADDEKLGREAERPKEQLTLSPERLAQIGKLSEVLTPIAEELGMVPAFTVTVGNTSAPLTIPQADGERLAYFFVEYMDAELFKRRLQSRSPDVQLQVAALSLAQVISAYSSEEVKGAEVRERFVLIPTMSAVSDALELMQEPPPPDRLSAASGLVPIFHIPSLLAQSASGKQRKILFFRKSDALNTYKNISLSQGDPEMPSEPESVLVSDLHTIAASLVATNSTDDVIFAPSSTALRVFRSSATRNGNEAPSSTSNVRDAAPGSSFADDGDSSLGLSEEEDYDDDDDALL